MRSHPFRIHALVILLYAGLTLLFLNPLSGRMTGALTDTVDPLLNTWIAAWDVHALISSPAHLFDANIFYAYPDALAYSETLLGSAFLVFPLALASNLPVFGHNLILFSGFVLGGYHAYLLGRIVTRSHLAAFLVGVIFTFNVYRLSMIPKEQMLTLQWLPLVIYYLWRVTQRARWRDGLMLALFLVLQLITTLYYGVFTALTLLFLAPLFLLANRRGWGRKMVALGAAALLSLMAVIPYARPYLRVSALFGLERGLTDAIPFSASLQQWGMVSAHNLLYGRWLALAQPPMVGPYPVDFLFPGFLTLALAAAGLLLARRGRRTWAAAALLLTLIAFVLSLGPVLMLEPLQPATPPLTLPYAWLHQHLPGFKALRAPARFAGFVMLGLALLAGMALAALQRRGAKSWLLAGLIALIFLESLSWPATSLVAVPQGDDIPPEYAWLRAQPPGVTVDLPAALPQQRRLPDRWLWPQYYAIYHWNPTPAGYSGFTPPRHESLIDLLNRFPSPDVLPLYRALDVRYVVLHRSYYDDAAWAQMLARTDEDPALTLAWRADDAAIVALAPAAAPVQTLSARLVLPPDSLADAPYAPLLILHLDPRTRALPPGQPALGEAIWEQDGKVRRRQKFAAVLPFLAQTRTAVNLALSPPAPGDYQVTVRLTAPVAVEASGPVHVADAAPAVQLLPIQLSSATAACAGPMMTVGIEWTPWGWVDAPQTIFLHALDGAGKRLAQVDESLSPSPEQWLPRTPVRTGHQLQLPDGASPASLRMGLYAWSDRYQTIIPARFFDPEGNLTDAVLLPIADCR